MTGEILAALNRIELFQAVNSALKIAPRIVVHEKETVGANDNKVLFENKITDYDFSTTNMILVTSLGTSNLGTINDQIYTDYP